ncbi:MAG: hypothetical protein ACLGHY_11185 [Gammaproteobacteria bacterium]
MHRDRALTEPDTASTVVEAALKWSAGMDESALRERLHRRRIALTEALRALQTGRDMYQREGKLDAASLAGYRRSELHLQAELAWHDDLDEAIADIAQDRVDVGSTGDV